MPNEYVSQREFDRYREGAEAEHARLRARLKALEDLRETDADNRRASVGLRIAGISAGAGVVAACMAVIALWHSSGR